LQKNVEKMEAGMEWWIISALTVVVLLLIRIYRIALRENRAITHYALLILLDEKVYRIQRDSLVEYVGASDAKRAIDLGTDVYLAIGRLAARVESPLGVAGLLWQLKVGPKQD
jgi:hypothetical protein